LSQALDFEDTFWFVKRIQLTTNSQESVFGFIPNLLSSHLVTQTHMVVKGNLSGSSFI